MTNEPRTQAGRALLEQPDVLLMMDSSGDILGINEGEMELHILAIEAEAAAPYEERLRILIQAVEDHMADPTNQGEPAAAEPPLYCGRCGHPMHWKQCDRDYLDGRCECRNDGERAAQPPPCPECGATYGR